ncbi:unnamed protein product [Cyprideis torosa]|uniref:Uncharacterized protein n=1 Tax=Cyprideis torosa TaxID=163714 RepID=A0A7R8W5T2_9CRUS|nr:unnamed protein product [Cyprideis torosa]CAG0880781.1 unnamed protein product [Cyprideis torosa]
MDIRRVLHLFYRRAVNPTENVPTISPVSTENAAIHAIVVSEHFAKSSTIDQSADVLLDMKEIPTFDAKNPAANPMPTVLWIERVISDSALIHAFCRTLALLMPSVIPKITELNADVHLDTKEILLLNAALKVVKEIMNASWTKHVSTGSASIPAFIRTLVRRMPYAS